MKKALLTWYSVMTYSGGMGVGGREAQEGEDKYTLKIDSRSCTMETNTTL